MPSSMPRDADPAATNAERTAPPLPAADPTTLLGETSTLQVDTPGLLAAAQQLRLLPLPSALDTPDPAAAGDGFIGAALSEIWHRYDRALDLLAADHMAAVDHITATATAYAATDAAIAHALSACSPSPTETGGDHPPAERGPRWP
jgi:hypothetical protein